MRKLLSTLLITIIITNSLLPVLFARTNFKDDVEISDWARPAIEIFENQNIISGYPDGTFKSKKNITRAEIATIFDKFLIRSLNGNKYIVPDIANSWAKDHIMNMVERDIIKGFPDNTFKPYKNVTRAELASILTYILYKYYPNYKFALKDINSFNDVNKNEWYYKNIELCAQNDILNGYPDNAFKPNQNITREELLNTLYKLIKKTNKLFNKSYYTNCNIPLNSLETPIQNKKFLKDISVKLVFKNAPKEDVNNQIIEIYGSNVKNTNGQLIEEIKFNEKGDPVNLEYKNGANNNTEFNYYSAKIKNVRGNILTLANKHRYIISNKYQNNTFIITLTYNDENINSNMNINKDNKTFSENNTKGIKKMKVLITGFDPFGGAKINPAYEAVKLLPNKIKNAEIIKLEIPTVFKKEAEIIEQAIKKHKPDIVICVGQAGGRSGITIEKVAINLMEARIPDNEKQQPTDEPIQKDGKNAYFTNLPIKAMVKKIRNQGISANISYSAGTFVCNDSMYRLLYMINNKYPNIRGGFIHVPYLPEQIINLPEGTPSMTAPIISKALKLGIEAALENEKDIKMIMGETN